MTDPARIADLESALREVITYLRALPLNPATTQQANAAEAVLVRSYSSELQAGLRYSYGGLVVGAQLNGTTLVLKTEPQKLEQNVQLQLEHGLQARLVRGITLNLKPTSGQFPPGFFSIDRQKPRQEDG